MIIKKLSQEKIKQIAAGEVINRPYNAIKELLENAIDADASEISIFLEEYGLSKIIIIDNGSGIEKEDLQIASQIHTTSKTSENDQIFGQNYLGFRGEALASIDAISELSIESNFYKWENNNLNNSNFSNGTKITIKNIFKKLPARLKFIKTEKIEFQYIKDIIQKYMINHPKITWNLSNNGKKIWNFIQSDPKERINSIFKDEFYEFQKQTQQIEISGYILKNKLNKKFIFANGRPIKNKAIEIYIKNIFKEYYMKNEPPTYILFIKTDPLFIDCNTHPAKEEVKFFNYEQIFMLISSAFSQDFFTQSFKKDHLIFNEPIITQPNIEKNSSIYFKPVLTNETNFIKEEESYSNLEISNEKDQTFFIDKNSFTSPLFKIIGQFNNSFIIFENEKGLGIFDQHAAHERILYEKLKSKLNKNFMQKLLIPISLELSQEQKEYINLKQTEIEQKGIIIKNYEITHIPITLREMNFKDFFEQNTNFDVEIGLNRLLADIACKNALKANAPLSEMQMYSLLKDALITPPICNHGRPVFKYFDYNQIKNWFKR